MSEDRAAAARERWRAIRVAHRETVAAAHRDALADPAYREQSGAAQYDALRDALGIKFSRATFYRIHGPTP